MQELESAVSVVIPAVRASIAKELSQKYHFSEEKIASLLGITQAAISKYLSGKYSKNIVEAESKVRKDLIESFSAKIAEGKREYVNICICQACMALNSFDCKLASRP